MKDRKEREKENCLTKATILVSPSEALWIYIFFFLKNGTSGASPRKKFSIFSEEQALGKMENLLHSQAGCPRNRTPREESAPFGKYGHPGMIDTGQARSLGPREGGAAQKGQSTSNWGSGVCPHWPWGSWSICVPEEHGRKEERVTFAAVVIYSTRVGEVGR